MEHARHAEESPRKSYQGLTTPMLWPSSAGCTCISASASEAKTLHASAAAATGSTHALPRSESRAPFCVRLERQCPPPACPPSSAFRFCAPAPAVCVCGVDARELGK